MRRALLLISAGAALVTLVAWLALRGMRPAALPESAWPTRARAVEAGALEAGWLPAFVPEGASELRELHDPTTTRTWGRFALRAPGWLPAASPGFSGSVELSLRGPPVPVAWWPREAEGKVSSLQLAQKGWRVTLVDEARGPVVVAVRANDALFWRLARNPGP